MGYVAVKGGTEAIEEACRLFAYQRIKGDSPPLGVAQIRDQLYLAVDKAMGEGGLYAPNLAALALKQAAGDSLEASFMLRAYRATQQRLGYSLATDTSKMRVVRRISSAFKDIPGGQILGATSDYTLRLLDFTLLADDESRRNAYREQIFRHLPEDVDIPPSFPKVINILRREGLLEELPPRSTKAGRIPDITREPLAFPTSRGAKLQALARGETGGMLTLAYSSMRGYGNIHPTLGELRVGYLPLLATHPISGEEYRVGEVKVTEAEVLARMDGDDDMPRFSLGYGLCFGQNEIKAISMAILDRCTRSTSPQSPAEDEEFVLYHIDGIEAMGFCNHWKLPHYVDFLSDLDRLRKSQELAGDKQREKDGDGDR
jgi:alpha-D-ribose 1-methylphosphonate 5-triphosphate synthase subunit PhnI